MLTETASQHINPIATSASAANTLTIGAVYQTRGLAQSENAPHERRSSTQKKALGSKTQGQQGESPDRVAGRGPEVCHSSTDALAPKRAAKRTFIDDLSRDPLLPAIKKPLSQP
jgi:hypothetical protein